MNMLNEAPPLVKPVRCRTQRIPLPDEGVPTLEMRGVSFAFENSQPPILDGLDLVVRRGEIVCLLGPSGCGKTTTLRLIAGLERPLQGKILLDGETIASPERNTAPERRGIGMVFQSDALFPHLTIAQNVSFGLSHLATGARLKHVAVALTRVGLDGYENAMPHMLSGGQRQRASLARALIRRPRIVLLDEAFANLDSKLREQIRDDTLHLLKAQAATAILVTHDPEEAMFMADRIALLRDGAIHQIGSPDQIYFTPNSVFAAEFLGETNRIETRVAQGQINTELGVFDARHLTEGDAATVVVRPEGVVPCLDGPIPAYVEEAHLLGRNILLHLSVGGAMACEPNGGIRPRECAASGAQANNRDVAGLGVARCVATHVHARVGLHNAPQAGDSIHISIDRRLAFVLPSTEETTRSRSANGHSFHPDLPQQKSA